MLNKGMDLSHYDPQVDWNKAKASGIDFVYIKSTQGTSFVDPMGQTHGINAKLVGIKIGYYHFADVTQPAASQAIFFLNQLKRLPEYDLLPVLDIETNKADLTPAQIETWIDVFYNELKDQNVKMMLHSYTPFLDQYLPITHNFGGIPLWIAQYRNVQTPQLPHGWTTASVWQYSNQGHVDGVAALTVDLNKAITQDFVL